MNDVFGANIVDTEEEETQQVQQPQTNRKILILDDNLKTDNSPASMLKAFTPGSESVDYMRLKNKIDPQQSNNITVNVLTNGQIVKKVSQIKTTAFQAVKLKKPNVVNVSPTQLRNLILSASTREL